MEVRLDIDNDIIKKFEKALKVKTANNVTRMALVVLSWVIDEMQKDRIIYSANSDNGDVQRLVFPWIIEKKVSNVSLQPIRQKKTGGKSANRTITKDIRELQKPLPATATQTGR